MTFCRIVLEMTLRFINNAEEDNPYLSSSWFVWCGQLLRRWKLLHSWKSLHTGIRVTQLRGKDFQLTLLLPSSKTFLFCSPAKHIEWIIGQNSTGLIIQLYLSVCLSDCPSVCLRSLSDCQSVRLSKLFQVVSSFGFSCIITFQFCNFSVGN